VAGMGVAAARLVVPVEVVAVAAGMPVARTGGAAARLAAVRAVAGTARVAMRAVAAEAAVGEAAVKSGSDWSRSTPTAGR